MIKASSPQGSRHAEQRPNQTKKERKSNTIQIEEKSTWAVKEVPSEFWEQLAIYGCISLTLVLLANPLKSLLYEPSK